MSTATNQQRERRTFFEISNVNQACTRGDGAPGLNNHPTENLTLFQVGNVVTNPSIILSTPVILPVFDLPPPKKNHTMDFLYQLSNTLSNAIQISNFPTPMPEARKSWVIENGVESNYT
jgi:hypothetical protein